MQIKKQDESYQQTIIKTTYCQGRQRPHVNKNAKQIQHQKKHVYVMKKKVYRKSQKGKQMRKNLKEARQKAGMTQKQVAEYLGITTRSYQRIENGDFLGSIRNWDKLEDLFNVHQRKLRLETCLSEPKDKH